MATSYKLRNTDPARFRSLPSLSPAAWGIQLQLGVYTIYGVTDRRHRHLREASLVVQIISRIKIQQ